MVKSVLGFFKLSEDYNKQKFMLFKTFFWHFFSSFAFHVPVIKPFFFSWKCQFWWLPGKIRQLDWILQPYLLLSAVLSLILNCVLFFTSLNRSRQHCWSLHDPHMVSKVTPLRLPVSHSKLKRSPKAVDETVIKWTWEGHRFILPHIFLPESRRCFFLHIIRQI